LFNKNISEKSAICNQQKYSLSNTRNINTDDSMNAENYIKAFQGVMGFYGLSFLIAPAKMVRSSCVAFKNLFLELGSKIQCDPNLHFLHDQTDNY
jgi:hypothetical protein